MDLYAYSYFACRKTQHGFLIFFRIVISCRHVRFDRRKHKLNNIIQKRKACQIYWPLCQTTKNCPDFTFQKSSRPKTGKRFRVTKEGGAFFRYQFIYSEAENKSEALRSKVQSAIIGIMNRFLLFICISIVFSGCAHVVSKEMRDRAELGISPDLVFQDPDSFKGRVIILGGFIVRTMGADGGSYIEVVQNPLDSSGRPGDRDISAGRFLIFSEGHVDSSIYSAGREVTVAGEVLGKKTLPVNGAEYGYPVIKSEELHLIKERGRIPIHLGIGIWKSF
jgi:outer membrane lipoprotein